jgi:hypothetical protein
MPARVANRHCRKYVQEKEEFLGNNLFGKWENEHMYVVYSYGNHWPLFVYLAESGTWLENESRTSVTTSKHRVQAHPMTDTVSVSAKDAFEVVRLAGRGYQVARQPAYIQPNEG